MKKPFKASSLRSLLTVMLIVMILAAGGGFYYGLLQVRGYAVEVTHTAADANASANAIDELQKLKQALAERETLVKKATQLFVSEANYQSQALKDVQRYAASIGLTIANTDFDTATTDPGPTTIAGKSFSISLKSPLSYQKLLRFLDAIEGNLPKMQIASIDVSRPTDNDGDQVNVGDVKIVISTR